MPHFNDDNYWYFCDAVNFLYSRHKLKTSQASDNFLQCFYETSSLPTITLKYFAITWREKSDYLFMHHLFKLIKLMIFAICLCLRNSTGYQIESYGNACLYEEMYENDCQNELPVPAIQIYTLFYSPLCCLIQMCVHPKKYSDSIFQSCHTRGNIESVLLKLNIYRHLQTTIIRTLLRHEIFIAKVLLFYILIRMVQVEVVVSLHHKKTF